ncbi:ABC transporter ATP-binding protein [Pseudoalteromonas carrageenovora]|uniref:ABC transporter ATP-binding protein n=1 Tax=Pseudoalteromonas carrageenovora TaxID=227 RepID=UPI0026E457F3|nr:ABC transporter ATP-binding protein [Pseudoalteromonas carrageenovora]MDO6637085.1 ABC transporter ATP-binding protein [Pseudoalteromonas carrageenovora]MDO6649295.1 ABC transporter ATP-binding protein [Pseudoalteromonas carrageenovora]
MHTKSAPNTPLLNVNNVSWGIANKSILNNINVQISPGKFVGLIGPNGAGKSSLLRCLYRFNRPISGQITFNNHDIWQLKSEDYAKQVAVVLQETPSQFNLSVFDVIALGLTPHKSLFSSVTNSDKQNIIQAINTVGLEQHSNQSFESLSGGEKQRALIARAIVQQPQLLIMDEPTSHLDVKYQIQVMELAKSLGVTVFASFHDLNLAAAMCDELLVIKNGEITHSGTPTQVLTENMLAEVFGVCAQVNSHPQLSKAGNSIPHITYFYGCE